MTATMASNTSSMPIVIYHIKDKIEKMTTVDMKALAMSNLSHRSTTKYSEDMTIVDIEPSDT